MAYSRENFYKKFKWDSVFQPIYKLVNIDKQGEQAVVTVTVDSTKLEFLHNNPLTCRYTFHFKSGKIAKIENLTCPEANWELWGRKVDSLVSWVKINHPELNGFIHDLTMQGAQNYIEAIDFYKNYRSAH